MAEEKDVRESEVDMSQEPSNVTADGVFGYPDPYNDRGREKLELLDIGPPAG